MVKEFILEDDLIIHRSCPLSDIRHPQGFLCSRSYLEADKWWREEKDRHIPKLNGHRSQIKK